MDIQIAGAELSKDGKYITVYRDITEDNGEFHKNVPERFPKETLAIRAAEYDMEIDDPRVLDQILLEGFYQTKETDNPDPLFNLDISDARDLVQERVEQVRIDNGAPEDPIMRSLFHAADVEESTQGLTEAKRLFLEHADPNVTLWVKYRRDTIKQQMQLGRNQRRSLADDLKESVLAEIHDEAKLEQKDRDAAERLQARLEGRE
jgi:hypothetical protein